MLKPEHEEALKKSEYQASLEYIEPKVNDIENNTNKLTQQKKFGSTHRLIKVLQPMWVEDS